MQSLAMQSWDAWDHAIGALPGIVVQPAMPILYFGDVPAYRASPLRVVTVALNPSLVEFPTDEPWRRFAKAPTTSAEARDEPARYLHSLDRYFEHAPYRAWFSTFEPILNGLGSSFYDTVQPSRAVHTDLCSPVPTNPTWSRLPEVTKAALIGHGRDLWHGLIRELLPHVILISVAAAHLSKIEFASDGEATVVHKVIRSNPYLVSARQVTLIPGHSALLVFGRAANKPFGTISNQDKVLVGNSILASLDD